MALPHTTDFNDPSIPANVNDYLTGTSPSNLINFSVQLSQDGLNDIFFIGSRNIPAKKNLIQNYAVYFAPMDMGGYTTVSRPEGQASLFRQAILVDIIGASPTGATVTFSSARFAGVDGWFFAIAQFSNGMLSGRSNRIRSPLAVTQVSLTIPPAVSGQTVTKTTVVVEKMTVSRVRASANVPSDGHGVSQIRITNPGTGYTSVPLVTLTGGLGTGGVSAIASAQIDLGTGFVTGVTIAYPGSSYLTPPVVGFTGGGGTGATAIALLGTSTAFDGFQIYISGYKGNATLNEGQYINKGTLTPGQTMTGTFDMIPDAAHTTTFHFVSVSTAGTRDPSGAPTATLIV